MTFYGDSSDFRLAGTKVILAELIIPAVLFVITGVWLAAWIFLLGIPPTWELLNFEELDYRTVAPEIIIVYSFLDLLLACLLYSAVVQLKCKMCLTWIILQVALLVVFTVPCFVCPFLLAALSPIFWQWIIVCVSLYLFKLYRVRIICFLMTEMKEEGRVWKHDPMYE